MTQDRQCTPAVARAILDDLIGDPDAIAGHGASAVPLYTYFTLGTIGDALRSRKEIQQLPEHDRMRDIVERLGLDGRAAV